MQAVFATIRKVTTSSAPPLVTGESGTGRELVAGGIHKASLRRMSLCCHQLWPSPKTWLNASCSGTRGVPQRRTGETAAHPKGNLFPDGTEELPVKLLRVLQAGAFQRVRERAEISIDAWT